MGRPPFLARARVLAICLFFLTCHASANKCNVGCHGMHGSKSAYQEGHTYTYELEGTTETTVAAGDAQPASIKLKATVELFIKPDCVRQLRIKGAQFNGSPSHTQDLQQHPVQFNYHDGHIDSEICAVPGDTKDALNVKRAVISLLQTAVHQESGTITHHETDVFGTCPTQFTFHKAGDSLTVQKYRDLLHCSHRETIRQEIVAATFDSAPGIKGTPLLASQQNIEQRYKRGILHKAVSTETYNYRPFSVGDAAIKTVIQTSLAFIGEKPGSEAGQCTQPKSLIFDPSRPTIATSVEEITKAIQAVRAEEVDTVTENAADKFGHLVHTLRFGKKNDILSVYHKVSAGAGFDPVADKKIFLNALFRAGGSDAAEVAAELIKNGKLTTVEELRFYMSLMLVQHINLPSLTSITSLLDQKDLPRIGYLAVGQVIGKYCQQHSCEDVPEVKSAIHKVSEKIRNGKTKTREQENRVISAIKALGNAKFMDDETLEKLAHIGADKGVRNRVRVAAIEALPSRCSMKWKNTLFKVFGNREEDSEIRIKTYLSLVACACPHVANHVKEVLDKETVNQVGSYVQSHLRNLRASTDPSKENAKAHLSSIRVRTPFPEDFRKFSYNDEVSYHIDGIGMGSAVESNLIYSQNSFVPRSASLNVTAEVFGRLFNYFELDTRIENLDRVIEHYFGPKGVVTNYDFEDLPSDSKDKATSTLDHVHRRLHKAGARVKREVKQGELDKFAKSVKLRGTEVDRDLDIDASVKLFGVELAYLSYQGSPEKFSPKALVDKIFDNLEKSFDVAKNFNYKYSDHLNFLEGEIIYPTGLGISMSFGFTGQSVVHLNAKGKIDIPSIFKDPKNAAFEIALEPSASIKVQGDLILEGCGIHSGVKLHTVLHTSTSSDVSFKVLDGKGIDVNFGIPKKKQELISVRTEIAVTPQTDGNYVPRVGKGSELTDCFDQFTGLLGLTICGQISMPYGGTEALNKGPYFLLNGPAKFAVTVENNDITKYHFKAYYNDKEEHMRSLEILLDTPNSKTNRHISLLVEGGVQPDKYAKVVFDSPIKKASAEVVLKNVPAERTLTVTLKNDQIEYYARAGLLASGTKYKPVLEYKVPEHVKQLLADKVGATNGHDSNVEGTVEVIDYEDGKKFVFDKVALVAYGRKVVAIDGTVISTSSVHSADLKVDYGQKNLAFKLNGKRLAEKNYEMTLSAVPSSAPELGFKVDWTYKRDQHEFKQLLVYTHGTDLNSKENRFTLDQHAVYKLVNPRDFILSGKNEITYPAEKLALKLEGKLTPKSISGDCEVKYQMYNLGTEVSVKTDMVKPGDYEVELELEALQNGFELKSKRTILDNHKSKFENSLVLSPRNQNVRKYRADGVVVYDVSKNNVNVKLDGQLNLNGMSAKIDTGLQLNPQVVNSRVFIIVDGTKYVEFVLKGQRGPHPNGELHIILKNHLNVQGQLNCQDGNGKGHIDIDIIKFDRKIKGAAEFTVKGTLHTADGTLTWVGKPDKVIKFSTKTDISKNFIDSKNVIEIAPYKLAFNGKCKHEGTLLDGHIEAEGDVTLPNGHYLTYKGKRTAGRKDGKLNVAGNVDITYAIQKGGDSRKLSYTGELKDYDRVTPSFISKMNVKYTDPNGKDLEAALDLEHQNKDGHDTRVSEVVGYLKGSIMPKPFEIEAKAEYGKDKVMYKTKSSFGNDFSFKGTGSLLRGNATEPWKYSESWDYKLPSQKLRNIKVDCDGTLLTPEEEGGLYDMNGLFKLTYNDDKCIKLDGHVKHSGLADNLHKSEGDGKITITILNNPPLTITSSYNHDGTGDMKKDSGTVGVDYGEKKASLEVGATYPVDISSFDLKAKATTPIEKLRNIDLQLHHSRKNDGTFRETDVTVNADGVKYSLNADIQTDETSPMVHVVLECPSGKTELLSKFQKVGDKQYAGEYKFVLPSGSMHADARVDLQSVDNFLIDVNFDCDKFKYRKIHAEIMNKPTAKAGKRIVVVINSDGKNIVTGSTNYKRREEEGKIIVEGKGEMRVGENTRPASFKYTRQQLTQEADGETGVAIVLNANFDPAAIAGELKLTNKEINVFNSYCEQSKDCAHFKLQSVWDTDQKTYLKHQITVELDLKKFHVPAEFGLMTSTEHKNNVFDHTADLYLHSSKDKTHYTYRVYVHPKESGVVLSLPAREMAVILTFDLPKTRQSGAYKVEGSVYLDRKNRPDEKTCVLVHGDANVDKNSLSLNGEAKFTYPKQPRPLSLQGHLHYSDKHLLDANVDFDVFEKKNQKISVSAKVSRQQLPKGYNVTSAIEVISKGQQLKLDLQSHLVASAVEIGYGTMFSYNDKNKKPKSVGVLFSANTKEVHLLVISPDREIIKSDTTIDVSHDLQKVDTEFAYLGNKPVVFSFEGRDFNSFKYIQHPKDNLNNKVLADGRIVIGQLAEIHADHYKDGAKQDLFHLLIHLDERQFLKHDFGYNKDHIQNLLELYRGKGVNALKQLKEVSDEIFEETKTELKDLFDHLAKAQPNIQPLLDYYQAELTKLKNEFHADETIKEIQATINKYFGAIFGAIAHTAKQVTEQVIELNKQFKEIIAKIGDAIKTVYPQLKESYDKIFQACLRVVDAATALGTTYVSAILNVINEHQKELKEIVTVLTDFFQDIGKICFRTFNEIKQDVDNFFAQLINQLKALPVYEYLKEKYQDISNFSIPEGLLSPIEDLCGAIKNFLPTGELRDFFDVTYQYVLKKAKHQEVDDSEEVKKIYQHGMVAAKSIIGLLQASASFDNISSYFEAHIPDFGFITKLPGIPTVRSSIVNLFRNRELPSLLDIYIAYRPTLYISDLIPPFSKTGAVVDGGHFFTFDGRHLTLPGTCTYILAQDMRDGNFSVVANFNEGNLLSVTVTEPKESITLKPTGNVLVNNKPANYPASTKNLHAFYTEPAMHVKSDYGVHVICSDKAPLICTVRVSGFYLGHIRGLLGDANNEPYDDFTLPSGKITENDSDFGNAYRLKHDCAAATAVEHKKAPRAQACTDYFSGYNSPMSTCFRFVNPAEYRDACDHAATVRPEGPCLIATAYYAQCYTRLLPGLSLPEACVTPCKLGNKDVPVGDTFGVKIPNKEADIIFVVEQDVQNEKIFKELVTPLMTNLREELKQHGLTDVYIGLIGYGEKMKWPQHYTLDGSRNIKGEVKHMKFEKSDPIVTFQEARQGSLEKKAEYLGQRLDVELGTFKLTDAYEEAIRYSFRPGAAKAVVGVLATPCEKSILPISLQHLRLILGEKIYRDLGLTYYHVYFPTDLRVSGKPANSIVGYDQNNAYIFADSKKKPLGGNAELRENLSPAIADVCADFAVSSGGAAFSASNFLEAKPNQKNQFAQVAARRIAEGLKNVELEEDCACQKHYGFVGRPYCKIVDRKQASHAQRLTKSEGVKG